MRALGIVSRSGLAVWAAVLLAVPAGAQDSPPDLGRTLYRKACQSCHGVNGDGKGPDASKQSVPPRDFRPGIYKWRSTPWKTLPTGTDIARAIRQGVPGTPMKAFSKLLSPEQIAALVEYVKSFSPAFQDPARIAAAKPVPLPSARPRPATPESIEAGRKTYERLNCALCHGKEGKGNGYSADLLVDDWGNESSPYDLTTGKFRGGASDLDIYRSLVTGLNGTPMRDYAAELSEEERWALVDYIQSLVRKPSFWDKLLGTSP